MNRKSRRCNRHFARTNRVRQDFASAQFAMREPFSGPQTFTHAMTLRYKVGPSGVAIAIFRSAPPLLNETRIFRCEKCSLNQLRIRTEFSATEPKLASG